MTGKINLHQPLTTPIQPGQQTPKAGKALPPRKGPSFGEILDQSLQGEGIKFSQHAQQRLAVRSINLEAQQLAKLNQAVEKAAQKGAKESLVLMNDVAFIVSITNRIVVTAVDGQNLKENVFTNIDSAVII